MGVSKQCTKCGEVKSIAQFYKQKAGLYGRTGECKFCRRARTAEWSSENRERKNAKDRDRKRDRTEYNALWRERNRDYFKHYYTQNREKRLAANRRWSEKSKTIQNREKTWQNLAQVMQGVEH